MACNLMQFEIGAKVALPSLGSHVHAYVQTY